ncbi:MAG: DUF2752 domain-containing protein [Jatrophihabitantaceae bacterium]
MTTDGAVRTLTRARAAPYRFAAVLGGATAVDVAVDPAHTHIPLCPFHAMTGWQCPFCGSLRAVNALVRGHPLKAVQDNLLLFLAVPVLALLWSTARHGRTSGRWRRPVVIALATVAVAFGVLRNLPFAAGLRP